MPEHISLLHYLLYRLEFLRTNSPVHESFGGHHLGYRAYEPVFMALLLMIIIVYLTTEVRGTVRRLEESTVPEEELTLRTFFEVFFEYFYNMAKDVMGAKNAKRFFPLIGASAIFIFVANAVGFVPGMLPPTSSLNITAGCAIVVFVAFNYYGLKENGMDYIKHMAGWGMFNNFGANLALAILMFPIEFISICVRPVTLAIRLMLNMAVDHLLVSLFMGFFAILVPLPIMALGLIVIVVQTLVFCLLTAIYIGLATEHAEEHH
ncbi:MAG: F0F1 ATP synthase subunit A [Polyangiaceae bacterium]